MHTDRSRRAASRRRRHLGRVLVRAALGLGATALLGPVVAFTLGYLLLPIPTPTDAVNNQVALVSFADGSPLARIVPEQGNRIVVPLRQVPPHVRAAVLAAEDRSFYSHPGFDAAGIARAAWNQVRGGVGGGSTITQQYVKNSLVGDRATLWRKFREVVVAVKISRERSKDEILGDYLNAIYFGRGAYGIQSAALAYFGRPVETLTPTDGALLAGLIQSPSRWDPAVAPERAVARWGFVLDGMVTSGRLSPADRASAVFPATVPRRPAAGGVPGDARGHVVTAVRAELADLGVTEQQIDQAGLRVTTTIDPDRQEAAARAVAAGLAGQPADLRSATVAIDPRTGGVLAYHGGDNGHGLDYARVRRLAGSTFKPFVVLAGLQEVPPIGLGEVFDGDARRGLRNADGAQCPRCDLKQAMTVSNNVVFADLTRRVGPRRVADAARAAGITAPLDAPNEGIALGNKEVSALELASAYATVAAGGIWRPPHLVARVVTADGRVLYQADPTGERRFSEQVARNVTETMLDVAQRDSLAPGHRPVAAKTGTVESRFPGENNDAWTAGFTPQLAASVWLGTDRNTPIRTAAGTPISGRTVPGRIWQGFMTSALHAEPVASFPPLRPLGTPPAVEVPRPDAPDRPTVGPAPPGTPKTTPDGDGTGLAALPAGHDRAPGPPAADVADEVAEEREEPARDGPAPEDGGRAPPVAPPDARLPESGASGGTPPVAADDSDHTDHTVQDPADD